MGHPQSKKKITPTSLSFYKITKFFVSVETPSTADCSPENQHQDPFRTLIALFARKFAQLGIPPSPLRQCEDDPLATASCRSLIKLIE